MNEQVVVLLASHNGAPWISEQVTSILSQARVDVRLVISDDASSDATLLKLEQFRNDRRVKIITHAAPSNSAAKNFIRLIIDTEINDADFFAFADQDDIWDPQKLARGCEQISKNDSSGYSCSVEAFWHDGHKRLLPQRPPANRADYLFEGAGQGCTFILTVNFFERVRVFLMANKELTSAIHYHDWMIYALSRAWKAKWTFDPMSMVSYRQHSVNDTGARASWQGFKRRLTLIRTGWYLTQLLSIAKLCKSAAPFNRDVERWLEILSLSPGIARKSQALYFCCRTGGRRRLGDQIILLLSIATGWI